MDQEKVIIVRGGGDLATGTIHRLWRAGFPVIVLETDHPAAIRRQVCISEAVYDGMTEIEGMTGKLVESYEDAVQVLKDGMVPVAVDPDGTWIRERKPEIVVDAILAKRNLGTSIDMAPLTIALGPGFFAGKDVHLVVETKRGHNLGRVIKSGTAAPDTGVPGMIGGYAKERVIHASCRGILHNVHKIGDIVEKDEIIATIKTNSSTEPVKALIPGIIRGLIREGYPVTEGFKIADIDPRKEELENCFTISDKARCIAGGVLEAVCAYEAGIISRLVESGVSTGERE